MLCDTCKLLKIRTDKTVLCHKRGETHARIKKCIKYVKIVKGVVS